jgi:hypothetical protein
VVVDLHGDDVVHRTGEPRHWRGIGDHTQFAEPAHVVGVGEFRVGDREHRSIASPIPEHLELRAARLKLAPETPAWERTPEQGLVSHRSAATLYGLGELPADRHEFTLPVRKQMRRAGVRIHRRPIVDINWINLSGLPVTRPARIAADLLGERQAA